MSLQKKDKSKGTVKKSGTHKKDLKATNNPKSDKAKRYKPAWMTKAPSATKKGKSKTVASKDYWWCDALACWCRHHPSKCEAKRESRQQGLEETQIRQCDGDSRTQLGIRIKVTPRGHSRMGKYPAGHR